MNYLSERRHWESLPGGLDEPKVRSAQTIVAAAKRAEKGVIAYPAKHQAGLVCETACKNAYQPCMGMVAETCVRDSMIPYVQAEFKLT